MEEKGRIKNVRIEYEVVRDAEDHDALFIYYRANSRKWAEAYRESTGGGELVLVGQWYADLDGISLVEWYRSMLGD